MGAIPQPFGSAARRDSESDPMGVHLRISVEVKVNVAAIIFALVALLHLFF